MGTAAPARRLPGQRGRAAGGLPLRADRPPWAGEDRTATALDAQHRLDPLHCGVCERRRVPDIVLCRPEEVGLVIRPAISGPLPDIEYLAGADDLPICARLRQRLARSVAEADAHCRRLRRPDLRLIH